ncbi:MAG: porin [Nibricoccus sp.]
MARRFNLLRTLITLPLFAGSLNAAEPTAPSSIEERLQRLEEEVSALRRENQELQRRLTPPAATPAPSPALAPASVPASPTANPAMVKASGREQSLTLGGFIQVQGDFLDKGDSRFSSDNDRIYLRRARISVAGRINSDFDFKVDAEMAGSLNETSGYRGQLADGFINWSRYHTANVRIGQFKTPFGYEQLASDITRPAIERSLPNDRLTLGRQIGAQVSGDFFEKRLTYATGVFNGTGVNTNANDNDAFLSAGRVTATPVKTKIADQEFVWSVGTNGYTSKDASLTGLNDFGFAANTFTGQRTGFGADMQLRFGAFDLWTEYLSERFKPSNHLPASTFESDGWSSQLSYLFLPKYWQGVVRFESFDPNTARAGNSTDNWVVGGTYFFGGDSVSLALNYYLTNAVSQPDHQQKIMVRLQTVF